ncbi:MAG: class I SAM-dependent methyltransferase [Desulfobulbaceae bacterium]|nr:class I SAM-dependent methyltransferase [Desulfobulbaceae bacterium]
MFDFVTSVRVEDGPEQEMRNYAVHDFRRFVYTLGLTDGMSGKCLELGANPYFTTMLLQQFTPLELALGNYFDPSHPDEGKQTCFYQDFETGKRSTVQFDYRHFNIEDDRFPYSNAEFDLVIFAEIIEHLLKDPCKVLREIKRVLRPGGVMILTTPNVARLENVARLISGENIYDPYSGYGPYGRHNREYNRHDLVQLLQHEGFAINKHFTADVHENHAQGYVDLNRLEALVRFRADDLGQYIFLKATKTAQTDALKRPAWLYRSYPANELE